MFLLVILLVAIAAGATASVVGFGIGSLLTPLVATRLGMPLAVALVAIPHALATGLRCWRLRAAIDWPVLRSFGVVSALGGLAGAAAYTLLGSRGLTVALGILLLLTSFATLTGWAARWTPHGPVVWLLGLASGAFGGLAGNQGGLRAAALGPFRLAPAAFVATATATGLLVDAARLPVYAIDLARMPRLPGEFWPYVAVASAGVLIGTIRGRADPLRPEPRTIPNRPRRGDRAAGGLAPRAIGVGRRRPTPYASIGVQHRIRRLPSTRQSAYGDSPSSCSPQSPSSSSTSAASALATR